MKSRYSAYALRESDYIIDSTHPSSSHFQSNRKQWQNEILVFCDDTRFDRLEIQNFTDGESEAFVLFTAYLTQNGQDATFSEKSRFLLEDSRWLYVEGEIISNQE